MGLVLHHCTHPPGKLTMSYLTLTKVPDLARHELGFVSRHHKPTLRMLFLLPQIQISTHEAGGIGQDTLQHDGISHCVQRYCTIASFLCGVHIY